jgi:hypothetical protein
MLNARSIFSGIAAAAVATGVLWAATIPSFPPNTAAFPTALQDYNSLIATLNSNISGVTYSFQPGAQTVIVTTKTAFYKVPRATVIDALEASAQTFTCSVNPVVTLYECGTSATCATPTTIGSATITAAGTVVDGTISAANIAAGDYIAWATSVGTCTVIDIAGTATGH